MSFDMGGMREQRMRQMLGDDAVDALKAETEGREASQRAWWLSPAGHANVYLLGLLGRCLEDSDGVASAQFGFELAVMLAQHDPKLWATLMGHDLANENRAPLDGVVQLARGLRVIMGMPARDDLGRLS